MNRPANLTFGNADKPPAIICLLNAIQHIIILSPTLAYPILALQAAGGNEHIIASGVSLALLAVGIGTALQCLATRYVGSGYLISFANSGAYYPVTVAAASLGGMALVAGMTFIAGATEVVLAQFVRRFRAFFPAEISGLCVLLIGIIIGLLGLRLIFGLTAVAPTSASINVKDIALGCGTLALMIGLNVWTQGWLRMYCAIIGIVAGTVTGAACGLVSLDAVRALTSSAIVSLPNFLSELPTFRADLGIAFAMTGLACCLRAMGDITNAQRINDRDWVRPDMRSIKNGLVADGLGTMVSSAIGGLGGNTFSASVGMANATGVSSRIIGFWTAGLLMVLSFFPFVALALLAIPRPVLGATLVLNACFILSSGLQIITSRLLDTRKTFVIGIALILSLSRDIFPEFYGGFPVYLQPFVTSDLTIGLLPALALNALFRIGITRRQTLVLPPGASMHELIQTFLEQQGARWGARRDVIERAIFGMAQAVESITDHCNVQGPITIDASFDEFNLDLRLSYKGDALVLEDRRPTDDEIRNSDEGLRRLAGYLLKRNADRVHTSRTADKSTIGFDFQH